MKDLHITIHKLNDHGADIRDYVVRKAIVKEVRLVVHYNDKTMTMDIDDLIFRNRYSSYEIQSKVTPRQYRLYNYKWIPDKC